VRGLLSKPARRRARTTRFAVLALSLLAAAAPGDGAFASEARSGVADPRRPASASPRGSVPFAQSAATLYALNCMGCHPPPSRGQDAGPLRGEFFHSARGRNFFIRVPQDGKRVLGAEEDARLLDEILTWKRSCAAILQEAPDVNYRGERFVK